jgi:hypothetical protein
MPRATASATAWHRFCHFRMMLRLRGGNSKPLLPPFLAFQEEESIPQEAKAQAQGQAGEYSSA